MERINRLKKRYMDLFVTKGKHYIEDLVAHVKADIRLYPKTIPHLNSMIDGLMVLIDNQLRYEKDSFIIKKLKEEKSDLLMLRNNLSYYKVKIYDIERLFERICKDYKEELALEKKLINLQEKKAA